MSESDQFFLLLVSKTKNDVVLIDANSEMWGEITYYDKMKLQEGKSVTVKSDGAEKIYIVVKHGTEDFSADLEDLRKELKIANKSLERDAGLSCSGNSTPGSLDNLVIKVVQHSLLFFVFFS